MCLTPKVPEVKPLQEVKQPDATSMLRNRKTGSASGMSGGSLLTGPAGIGAAPTAKTSLLGQ